MIDSNPYKSKHFWWLVLKLVILFLLGYFIYYSLKHNSEITWQEFYITVKNSEIYQPITILLLLLFTLVNWTLEILKWKILANKIQSTSYFEAAIQSLASHAFALITPNRIGEYGAKALYYKKEDRKRVMLLNFVGNFYQMMATVLFGVLSFAILSEWMVGWGPFSKLSAPIATYIASILGVVLVLILLLKVPYVKRQKEKLTDGRSLLSVFKTSKVLGISLLRYLVFAIQFHYLINLFQEFHPFAQIFVLASIGVMYLLASIVPMLSMFDFIVKGSVAVFVFSFLGVPPMIVLTITTLMWLLNFVLPAVLGGFFILKFKFVES